MARVRAENVLLSCEMLYFHFFFGLFLIFWGALTLVARLPIKIIQDKLRPWHATMGQFWMYGMICQICTSLYTRGDGFRIFIFSFLVILVSNMVIGHSTIRVFQRRREHDKMSDMVKNLKMMKTLLPSCPEVMAPQTCLQTEGGEVQVPVPAAQTKIQPFDDIEEDPKIATGVAGLPAAQPVFGADAPKTEYRISSRNLIKIHGFSMVLSYMMLFGAGIMFSRRSENLRTCLPMYAVRDTLDGEYSIIWKKDGVKYMGGATCVGGMITEDVFYDP